MTGRLALLLLAAILAAACATPGAGITPPPSLPPPSPPPAGPKAEPPPPAPTPEDIRQERSLAAAGRMQEIYTALVAGIATSDRALLDKARELTAEVPQHPYSWLLLGFTARRLGGHVLASVAFRRALELSPADPTALLALGEMAAESGSAGSARDLLLQVWKASPTPENANRLAVLDISAGRLDEAKALLAAAREAAPSESALTNNLAAVLDMSGFPAQALSLLSTGPSLPTSLLLARVGLELRQGQLERASLDLDLALTRGEGGGEAGQLLGLLKMQRGNLAGAEEQFRKMTQDHPSQAEGYLHLGLVLRRQGRFAEAEKTYLQGLQVREIPELHLNLAVLKELYQADRAAALFHYRRYLELGGAGGERVKGWHDYLAGQIPAADGTGGSP